MNNCEPSFLQRNGNSSMNMCCAEAAKKLTVLAAALLLIQPAIPAELTIADGVVVKFSNQSRLVVRDKITVSKDAVLTSRKDASSGGSTAPADQAPAQGDWYGVRIEKSAAQYGVNLQDFTVRYAGAEQDAALVWRNFNLPLPNPKLLDNTVGLRLLDGASTNINGGSFLRNGVGIELSGNSEAMIVGSQFSQNNTAILNHTPQTITQASGNWWAHSSGPKDVVNNPNGQGDAVSTGVNYSAYLTSIPLINPSVRVIKSATYYETHTLELQLACTNATEYRLAETNSFTSVPFQPMGMGSLATSFTFSAQDGRKTLYVQYRNVSGETVTKALEGGVLIDTQAPSVVVSNPAAGSVLSGTINVEATATDGSGIAAVNFYVDDILQRVTSLSPYKYEWNTDAFAEGDHVLRVVALDQAGRSTALARQVSIFRTPLPPDTDGPVLSNIRLNGAVLTSGLTLTNSTTINLDAGDRSGVSRVELLLDDVVIGSFTGSSTYAATLNIDAVANGAHVLTLRASDSLNNVSVTTYDITVAHAPPAAPVLKGIVNGTLVRETILDLTGTAPANTQVQLYVNGVATGEPVVVGANSLFMVMAPLVEGSNELRAKTIGLHGESVLSTALTVVRDTTVPLPPGNLASSSQLSGLVRLAWNVSNDPSTVGYHVYRAPNAFTVQGEALRINDTLLNTPAFDDLPSQDGTYFYRVVAVNAVGTFSPLSNMVQAVADKTAPRASLVYMPQGQVDATTGTVGQGAVAVTLTVSEPLQTTPYFAIVPLGSAPMPVELTKLSDTRYEGRIVVTSSTGSGLANALFSARDTVGNRGTAIDAGATLTIDTEGPTLTNIAVTPGAPIKNDSAQTLNVTFTLSDAVKSGSTPAIGWTLSGVGHSPQVLSDLTVVDATTWTGTLQLPATAGANVPETLAFNYSGSDALDNSSTRITAANAFQVYQGDLPSLSKPLAFTAKAQSGGKVSLSWQAVDEAAGYQLYRQAPGDADFVVLSRVTTVVHIDQTSMDGSYRYAVAALRTANGQESLSALSDAVSVLASATAPGAPQNLALEVMGQGIKVSWQPPLSSVVHSYRVYRSTGTQVASVEGMMPLRTNIATPLFVDSTPSLTEHVYVVTAVDAAGNESPVSNSAYLNASLLPVPALRVERQNSGLPLLSWEASRTPVAGYHVYVGAGSDRVRLNDALITTQSFTDNSYTQGSRLYAVAAVDNNGVEMPREIPLHDISLQLASGLPVKRGVMNRLMVQVSNNSATAVDQGRVVVQVGGRNHLSENFALSANQTHLVPVVVGGYSDLPANAPAKIAFEAVPHEGELISLADNKTFEVTDSSLVVGIATESFTRGATGQVRLSIENTTDVEVELLTARNSGNTPSDELRFKLLDTDGNVLAVQSYQQALGSGVVTLSNGLTVARIPAATAFTSDPFTLTVPGSTPTQARLRLEVDKLRYHSGQPDEVIISGRGSEAAISLVETAYAAEVVEVTPANSYGDEDVVITGRAFARNSQTGVANAPVKLLFNQQGFERSLDILTDNSGNFRYVFTPGYSDAGLFKVAAVHPDITDKPEQKSFTIQRLSASPTVFKLTVPRNYSYSVPVTVTAGLGSSASNVRLVLDESVHSKPDGVTLELPAPVTLVQRQTLNTPVVFTADNTVPDTGTLQFKVYSDERPVVPLGLLTVEYVLSEAKPHLISTPSFVETGLAMGGSQMESVMLENKGLQDALDLQFALTLPDGSPAPTWATLTSNVNGTLKVGERRVLNFGFAPPSTLAAGIYEFRLKVRGTNVPDQSLNVFASVTASGEGNALFKTSDIYTATVDKNGNLIPGLAGARIMVQNEDVLTVSQALNTDSQGEAYFQALPTGFYKFKATAANHQELNGRFQIKPGITTTKPIFLEYNVVTVEWSVREITIEDRYEITLNATFETDVPTAVVVLQPASTNLPPMKPGEVYYGELILTNYGLVRADNVSSKLPVSDTYFKYEFLADVPESLEAKSRVVIPYRVIGVASTQNTGEASGGGCFNMYHGVAAVNYSSRCANGDTSNGSTQSHWYYGIPAACQVDGSVGGGSSSGGTVFGGGGSLSGGGSAPATELPSEQPCQKCGSSCCGAPGGGGGNGSGE